MPTDLLPFDGTVRACVPDGTWQALVPRLPHYGITRVADLTGLDYLCLPVCMAHRPNAHTLTASQGKGATHRLAAISAVMEAIELWHAEQPAPVDTHAPAYAVPLDYPLDALPLRIPPTGLPELAALTRIPQDWTMGTGLTTGRSLLAPTRVISRDAQPMWAPALWRSTSTGLACGNTHDEAVAHALFEVIERHALYVDEKGGGTLRTLIDPATVDDTYARSLIDRIHHSGATLELFIVDNTFGMPVCLAYLWSEDYPVYFAGSGCHLDASIALSRAITEAAQSRLTNIAGTRDDLPSHADFFASPQPTPEPLRQPMAPWRTQLKNYPALTAATFADLVRTVATRLEKTAGFEPIAVTLSDPDAPLVAVKVVAPGARSRTRRDIPR
ncbi:YcaO-like family protein [Streptomyces sp. CA-251387]|uniref:YcaO-like family protein n=1 Tax=Streptomyces sp. CA-251387 TaxID=3240064 RepID=UPI003D91E744